MRNYVTLFSNLLTFTDNSIAWWFTHHQSPFCKLPKIQSCVIHRFPLGGLQTWWGTLQSRNKEFRLCRILNHVGALLTLLCPGDHHQNRFSVLVWLIILKCFYMDGCGQALAAELAPKTRVNGIAPGFVPTRFSAFLTESAEIVLSLLLYPLYGN